MSMMNPNSRVTGEVSTGWPQLLTLVNDIGVHRLQVRITRTSDVFIHSNADVTEYISASCAQSSIPARACVWLVGKVIGTSVSSAHTYTQTMLNS